MNNTRIAPSVIAHIGADNLIDGQLPTFAWPGGYPIFYLTESDTVLCPDHANVESDFSDELITAADVNWEDADLYCEHGHRIESAYAED